MAVKILLNETCRKLLLGHKPSVTSTGLSFSGNTISLASGSLLAAGFRPDDITKITGSGSNNDFFTVASVAANGASMVVVESLETESAGASVTIEGTGLGRGLRDIFKAGVIGLWSGDPATSDGAESGTLMVVLTKSSGAFTRGTKTNGLTLDSPSSGLVGIPAGESWTGVALATGTIGSGYFYDNAYLVGAASLGARFGGTVGVGSGVFNLTSLSVTAGEVIGIQSVALTQKAA